MHGDTVRIAVGLAVHESTQQDLSRAARAQCERHVTAVSHGQPQLTEALVDGSVVADLIGCNQTADIPTAGVSIRNDRFLFNSL